MLSKGIPSTPCRKHIAYRIIESRRQAVLQEVFLCRAVALLLLVAPALLIFWGTGISFPYRRAPSSTGTKPQTLNCKLQGRLGLQGRMVLGLGSRLMSEMSRRIPSHSGQGKSAGPKNLRIEFLIRSNPCTANRLHRPAQDRSKLWPNPIEPQMRTRTWINKPLLPS